MINNIRFKNIKFLNISDKDFPIIIKKKGLFLFPSGPGLSNLDKKPTYLKALHNADFNFFDSGYFVILLSLLKNIKVNKFSGYKFFKLYINFLKKNKELSILSINPSKSSSKYNISFFNKLGFGKNKVVHYNAPIYNPNLLEDHRLLKVINKNKPEHILINLGGNIQEILGFYIKSNIKYKPSIFCTGAAISYFTKEQAPINNFVDNINLGWLIRILYRPNIFLTRYIFALRLFLLVIKNKIKIIYK